MDAQQRSWPPFAQHGVTSAPCDQDMMPLQTQPDARSQSQDAEWKRIVDEVGGSNGYSSPEFAMFSSSDAAMLHCSPRQSIEVSSAQVDQPPLSATGSSGSSSLSSVPCDEQFPIWQTTSTPLADFPPPPMTQYDLCMMSQPFDQPAVPNGLPHYAPGITVPEYHSQPMHQLATVPSPFLHPAAAYQYGSRDGAWDGYNMHRFPRDSSGDDATNDVDSGDPCYAQLLWRSLKEAPGHVLPLKELYKWVTQHSQKAKDPTSEGWRNSVRHNLSMNAAFEKVPTGKDQGVKKSSLWGLTPHAVSNGVISTTRYRKDPKRKPKKRSTPAAKRQISGKKGGQATRAASRRQKALRGVGSFPNLDATRGHHGYQTGPFSGYYTPTSMHSALPSPQEAMFHPPAPPSPYCFDFDDQAAAMPFPSPQTPSQMQLMYGGNMKPAVQDFEFGHIDLTQGGLFGNHDHMAPDTPSLATEASFVSEDDLQLLVSHDLIGEATSFPIER